MTFKLSKYRAETPSITDTHAGTQFRVIMGTRLGEIRILSESVWLLLVSGKFDQIPESILADLTQAELIVPEGEDELKTILTRDAATAEDHKTAKLVIQPTAACQFGCGYCGQTHRLQFLSENHQRKLVERTRAMLTAGRGCTALDVSWFGGEPTMASKQMQSLTHRLKATAAECGCSYGAMVVTNGYLLNHDFVTDLVNELDVSAIEITIDGSREHHNRSRPTKSGTPTFDRVFRNAVAIAQREDIKVRLTIRCNVSRTNREGVLKLLEDLAAEGVQKKIGIYPAPIHDWGNTAQTEYGSPMQDFADWEVAFLIRAIQLGFPQKLLPARKKFNCMTFKPGAEMIDAYGNRFNCTEVSYVDAYETMPQSPDANERLSLPLLDTKVRSNRYAIGHLDQADEIAGRRELLGDFYTDVESGVYPCHDCNMFPTCKGHCPKSWREGTPACPSPKFNISERLMIFYAMKKGILDPNRT